MGAVLGTCVPTWGFWIAVCGLCSPRRRGLPGLPRAPGGLRAHRAAPPTPGGHCQVSGARGAGSLLEGRRVARCSEGEKRRVGKDIQGGRHTRAPTATLCDPVHVRCFSVPWSPS